MYYQINEGKFKLPEGWLDQSMHIFTLPQSDINLTINRMPIPTGLNTEDYIDQVLYQFRHNLKGYQELDFQHHQPEGVSACTLTYCWQRALKEKHIK